MQWNEICNILYAGNREISKKGGDIMKRLAVLLIAALFVFGLTANQFIGNAAAYPGMTEKKAEPEKEPEKKATVKQITGDVTAVDTTAKTVTVKGKKAEVVVATDEKTVINIDTDKKSLADVKVGDKVTIKYTEVNGKNVAKSITVKMAEKKAEPAAPAEPAKKK